MKELRETHRKGLITIENLDTVSKILSSSTRHDLGIQISQDGRVWICVEGVAFLRFKPEIMGRW